MSEPVITKRCSRCKEIKALSEFHRRADRIRGFQSHCKKCQLNYGKTPQGKKAYKRYAQSIKGIATQQRYYQTNKEKSFARAAIGQAIKKGRLPAPTNLLCSCGEQSRQWHHWHGYDREHWLDVIPVCIPCHKFLHRKH